jgi:hypothetical protein
MIKETGTLSAPAVLVGIFATPASFSDDFDSPIEFGERDDEAKYLAESMVIAMMTAKYTPYISHPIGYMTPAISKVNKRTPDNIRFSTKLVSGFACPIPQAKKMLKPAYTTNKMVSPSPTPVIQPPAVTKVDCLLVPWSAISLSFVVNLPLPEPTSPKSFYKNMTRAAGLSRFKTLRRIEKPLDEMVASNLLSVEDAAELFDAFRKEDNA